MFLEPSFGTPMTPSRMSSADEQLRLGGGEKEESGMRKEGRKEGRKKEGRKEGRKAEGRRTEGVKAQIYDGLISRPGSESAARK